MANLVVIKFEAADGASLALELVKLPQPKYMLELFDAVVVSWPKGAKKAKTQQSTQVAGKSTLDGAF